MKLLAGSIAIVVGAALCATPVFAGVQDRSEFDIAKAQYEASAHDEAARLRYVTKLAAIRERQVDKYLRSGERDDDSATAINEELRKHPAPSIAASRQLSQLLVGKWQSPRRVYVFRADGKCGTEDEERLTGHWRIKGNQLIQDGLTGTIILLDQNYLIYAEGQNVFFHSRVKA